MAKALLQSLASASDKPEYADGGGDGGGFSLPASPTVISTMESLRSGPPIVSSSLERIEAVARKNGVAPDDLGELFTCVFAEVLLDAVSSDSDDLTELSEVIDFAKEIGLSEGEIGDGLSLAASRMAARLNRDSRGFVVPTHGPEILLHTSKLFFVADKLMGDFTGFYGKRFSVAMSFFTPESLRALVSEASSRYFRLCISSVLSDPSKYSADEIEKLREFLAASPLVSELRPANMQNMIMESLQGQLDLALKAADATPLNVKISNYDTLQKSQEVLGWNPLEFSATMEIRTLPVFEAAAKQLIEEVMEAPERAEELGQVLAERMEALNVDAQKARVKLTNLLSEKNAEYMFKMERVYNASGGSVEPVFKIMSAYAESHAALSTFASSVMGEDSIPLPGLPFAEMVRVSMYKMQLVKKDGSVTPGMFSLNEAQQKLVRKNMALPKVTSWITQCIREGNLNADAKAAYKKLFQENGVTDEEWRATSVDFYYQELQRIASLSAVPSEASMARLASIQQFLDCPPEAVARVNLELLGDKYAKALTEAMTPSGVITEEYVDGLERLRNRLGLSKENAQSILSLVTRSRMAPLVKDLASQWKSDVDANKREAGRRDKSGDRISSQDNVLGFMETGAQKTGGGPNVFMREAINMIDLMVENYALQGIDIRAMDAPPVTAAGVQPEKELVEMFKHYLITTLTEQDPELKQRYQENQQIFGKLLGIPLESQGKVKESLAYTAYKNLLKNVMRVQDAVGTDEIRQFAMLKEGLGLDQATADRIFDECSRGAVIETAAAIMRSKDAEITADTARRLRTIVC